MGLCSVQSPGCCWGLRSVHRLLCAWMPHDATADHSWLWCGALGGPGARLERPVTTSFKFTRSKGCELVCCRVVGADGGCDSLLEASRDPTRKRLQGGAKLPSRFGLGRGGGRASRSGSFSGGEDALAQDFTSKLLHLSWHPQANVIATAASNSLYLFYGGCCTCFWGGGGRVFGGDYNGGCACVVASGCSRICCRFCFRRPAADICVLLHGCPAH